MVIQQILHQELEQKQQQNLEQVQIHLQEREATEQCKVVRQELKALHLLAEVQNQEFLALHQVLIVHLLETNLVVDNNLRLNTKILLPCFPKQVAVFFYSKK